MSGWLLPVPLCLAGSIRVLSSAISLAFCTAALVHASSFAAWFASRTGAQLEVLRPLHYCLQVIVAGVARSARAGIRVIDARTQGMEAAGPAGRDC